MFWNPDEFFNINFQTLSYLDYSIIAEKQQESAESQNAKEL